MRFILFLLLLNRIAIAIYTGSKESSPSAQQIETVICRRINLLFAAIHFYA
ncbi:hypothetical protein D920_02580 [Enterococcus faecalis 13-SD-W-01]|nr:hypothetical protein D920_02580 [Enterococcus faecalis 13-SD-W-01]